MPLSVRLEEVSSRDLANLEPAITRVYSTAFGAPPHSEDPLSSSSRFPRMLEDHASHNGFQLVLAWVGDEVAGFVYGFLGRPGELWYDTVAEALTEDVGSWMEGFELAVLAVDPRHQGHGIGGGLHDDLIRRRHERRALLTTVDQDGVASSLYLSRGWRILAGGLVFPNDPLPYRVMGLDIQSANL